MNRPTPNVNRLEHVLFALSSHKIEPQRAVVDRQRHKRIDHTLLNI